MLKPVPHLKLHPEIHRYRYKDKWLLNSVTGVVGHEMSQEKKAAINFYKDGPTGWAARGTALHSVLENLLIGKEIENDDLWQEWIEPLKRCELFEGSETLAAEYSVCDPVKSIGGQFDFLIKTKAGEIVLGDLKTSSTKRAAKKREPANEQLGAYKLMLEKHHPNLQVDKCCTLVLGPDYVEAKRESPETCVNAWKEVLEKFQLTQEDW